MSDIPFVPAIPCCERCGLELPLTNYVPTLGGDNSIEIRCECGWSARVRPLLGKSYSRFQRRRFAALRRRHLQRSA